jgi:hypothetical protein
MLLASNVHGSSAVTRLTDPRSANGRFLCFLFFLLCCLWLAHFGCFGARVGLIRFSLLRCLRLLLAGQWNSVQGSNASNFTIVNVVGCVKLFVGVSRLCELSSSTVVVYLYA